MGPGDAKAARKCAAHGTMAAALDSGSAMSRANDPDQDAHAEAHDQRAIFDERRERCPVAHDEALGWSLYRHHDVLRVLADHETFSNTVSRHLSVPNGMDPPEHTAYRRLIEPYFSASRMAAFEPSCRGIAARRVGAAVDAGSVELMQDVAGAFAAEAQCAFLGWPMTMHEPLRSWTQRNQEATRAGDRERLSGLAREFETRVEALLAERRGAGAGPGADVTTRLLHEQVQGRPLRADEIVSILRNWTVGEVGTISASVGILAHHLAEHPGLQQQLRAEPERLPAAIDEILRLDGPLVANRRRPTRPVEIGGQRIDAGERLSIVWIAANRDPAVFDHPGEFRWDRDPADNLLYGAGIHVCPGAPLARLELRVMLEELLRASARIEPDRARRPLRATWPGAGFERLPLRLTGH